MGNSTSTGRGHQQDTVDLGFLIPQGVYTGPRDWNQTVVTQLICERKLAPFYRPLEDYDESWDDDQILAARREPQDTDPSQPESSSARPDSISSSASKTHHKRPSNAKEPTRQPEVAVYRGAVECPICFLVCPIIHINPPHDPIQILSPSITPQTSITQDVVTRLYAQSASFK